MPILTKSFDFNGVRITVQKPNGFSRVRVWQLRQEISGLDAMQRSAAFHFCYYLANTIAVEGSLGFPVPCDSPSHDELMAFINGIGEADEQLLMQWDEALSELLVATNDPDLLPPHELDEKKEPPPTPKSSD